MTVVGLASLMEGVADFPDALAEVAGRLWQSVGAEQRPDGQHDHQQPQGRVCPWSASLTRALLQRLRPASTIVPSRRYHRGR
jgi:hypothetical protein